MHSKPPYYKQETPYSCAPACLRMVMEALGVSVTEQEIRRQCDCDEEGTTAKKLEAAAREFGFPQSKAISLVADEQTGLRELAKMLAGGFYPIVYLKMSPPFDLHAVVIVSFIEDKIQILDPYFGERRIEKESFMVEWIRAKQTVILVER